MMPSVSVILFASVISYLASWSIPGFCSYQLPPHIINQYVYTDPGTPQGGSISYVTNTSWNMSTPAYCETYECKPHCEIYPTVQNRGKTSNGVMSDWYKLTLFYQLMTCWGCNIMGKNGQYHDCWCPSSLHHQAISSYDINYLVSMAPCLPL